ncbi:MAG: hypothetical protein JXN10_12285, partial [Clostridia bacterium]|nr:hypothetical protein [Clostridia bacterium]
CHDCVRDDRAYNRPFLFYIYPDDITRTQVESANMISLGNMKAGIPEAGKFTRNFILMLKPHSLVEEVVLC